MIKENRTFISKGFSLVEILVVLAICAVLLLWAVPNLLQWQAKKILQAEQEIWVAALQLARSQAITEGDDKDVFFCAVGNGTQCLSFDSSRIYGNKWEVFTLKDNFLKKVLFKIDAHKSIVIKTNARRILFDEQGRPGFIAQYVLCNPNYAIGTVHLEMRRNGQILNSFQANTGC